MAIITQNTTKQGFFDKLGYRGLYNCKECSTNHPFLCKTNPNSKITELTQSLSMKQLTKNSMPSATPKTNPKRTQTNPNSKNTKNEHNLCLHKELRKFTPVDAQKNKPNSNPNKAKLQNDKNERKLSISKGLRK
jgi:hypothetical protein